MQHSELLHRFFDEGLDEPLEDVLFGQMALDPELRREFISHLQLHSIIQEDVAGITTPSHVSQQLLTTLGLIPPELNPPSAPSRLWHGAGTALLRLRRLADAHRGHLYTAVVSALVTAVLLLNFTGTPVDLLEADLPASAPADAVSSPLQRSGNAGGPEVRPLPSTDDASIADDGRTAMRPGTSDNSRPAARDRSASAAVSLPGLSIADDAGDAAMSGSTATAPAQAPPSLATFLPAADGLRAKEPLPLAAAQETITGLVPEDAGVEIATLPESDAPWRFFQPGPRENFLSNLVFELRKVYGTSYPDVDLPHNSFTVFQNMAISAVYKTTEHHAFGFEYGRENFGREFQRSIEQDAQTSLADPSMAPLYRTSDDWLVGPQRENRMLDLFGAVWKLSLPEYGLFDVVYPYLRTFVGATKLGPLGKVRAGLEMYPSNFSMLNVGVEGGMLRYTVDDMAYYTAKLNFTFGVAIGF